MNKKNAKQRGLTKNQKKELVNRLEYLELEIDRYLSPEVPFKGESKKERRKRLEGYINGKYKRDEQKSIYG